MKSYLVKIITFSTIIYMLLISSSIISAFAHENVNHEKTDTSRVNNVSIQTNESNKKFLTANINKKTVIQNTDNMAEHELPDYIARNLQAAGNLLSLSPSELAEQAKSYALSKVNRTIASEAQKWLSQFSTAKINFGFDRKGRLENNSVDLLLPIYDNKVDWLFFSQLGYRNKDSRNTVNLGLGGRYFSQNWMYGLNTFYDYDITGKNRRVGLGGEIWGDYIKFSTNAYYRLSDWQISQDFEKYHERPANGYDINGEFFLPAYPNLGSKFSYEQYFGDYVTLFNRKTTQKNPILAKIGMTYTPIPLITMGVDYKQGESGQSEAQFQANFNLRLGVPLSTQLSPDNVASMRTLTGSRYDLVDRNNDIVLDHQKIAVAKFSMPKTIVGYSGGVFDIPVKFFTDVSVKDFYWTITGNRKETFEKSGGKISYQSGNIQLTFPKYLPGENQDANNSYTAFVDFKLANHGKTEPKQIQIIVKPFMVQKKEGNSPNFMPPGPLSTSGEAGYTFNPKITFDTPYNSHVVKNITFNKLKWVTEPPFDHRNKLKFHPGDEFNQVKTDENGNLSKQGHVILTSGEYVGDVKIYLMIDNQPKQLVNTVRFHKENVKLKHNPVSNNVLVYDTYQYTAIAMDDNGKPIKGQKVEWDFKVKKGSKVKFTSQDEKTGEDGKANATLTSLDKAEGVVVFVTINGQTKSDTEGVNFDWPTINKPIFNTNKPNNINNAAFPGGSYELVATVDGMDSDSGEERKKHIEFQWSITNPKNLGDSGLSLSPYSGIVKADPTGKLNIVLKGSPDKPAVTGITVCVNIVNAPESHQCIDNVGFINKISHDYYVKSIEVFPKGDLTADGTQHYQYTALIVDKQDNDNPARKKTISGVKWTKDKDIKGLILTGTNGNVQTDNAGKLTATLTSTQKIDDVLVSLSIENHDKVNAERAVSFKPEQIKNDYYVKSIDVYPKGDLTADGNQHYQYTALIVDKQDNDNPARKKTISGVKWTKDKDIKGLILTGTNGNVQTDNAGKLTATLTSTQKIDDVLVSLSIENNEKVNAERAVSFKSEQIKITSAPQKKQLVYGTYTYTVTVTGVDGQPEKGKDVHWNLIGNNPNVSLKSGSTKTDEHGQATATLTSINSNAESNVIVEVRVDGNKKSADPVDFALPIIHSVGLDNTSNGSVSPGDDYNLIASVLNTEGGDIYTGNNLEFMWTVHPENVGLSLAPAKENRVSGGELKTKLKSDEKHTPPNTIATVCLVIAGSPKLSEEQKKHQCTEVKFKTPPLKIYSLDVGIYDSQGNFTASIPKPLLADGNSAYIFRAKILQGNTPYSNKPFNFSQEGGWSRNYEKKFYDVGLEDPKRDSKKYRDNFDKTDADGYLYASLKSQVGIDGVNVKLILDKNLSKVSNNVNFTPEVKKATLRLFNTASDSSPPDYKINTTVDPSQPFPTNAFSTVGGNLLDSSNIPIRKSNRKLTKFTSTVQNITAIDNDGGISFQNVGTAELTAEITNNDDTKEIYTYTTDVKRYFNLNNQQFQFDTSNSCESKGLYSPDINDVIDEPNKEPITLMTEFPDLSKWNLIPIFGTAHDGSLLFYVFDGLDYAVYNSTSNNVTNSNGGYVVCMLKLKT
ncbi:inverse autotransporter beta domain-containing protein [Xenorhabdus sp. IM139775]|uniref:inverse autotransporter beta domain-containing protein n=1 Tax=Xenorhabdus sp. IM139775 TaxID=3025876 RepID=UPI0023583173|nr:inverse autotransporter beta domain-containing protein [Xenorhabdus sp. IM139775]MDC9594871.1 inverse autotransporter beta domain-containing protein [Xenorhabdus sp. IM139775]